MLRLALSTLRFRKGGFIATFVALFIGTAVVLACGGLMESGVRTAIPPQRLAAAPVVVAGNQTYDLPAVNPGTEDEYHETATLAERVRLDAGLANTIAAVPGVAKVVPDVSFPAEIPGDQGGRTVPGTQLGHDWATAELAPYALREGRAPERPGEVVLDEAIAGRTGARPGSELPIAVRGGVRNFQVAGIASAGRPMATDAVFFSAADARVLATKPGQVDAFGVLPAPGADPADLRQRVDAAVRGHHAVTLAGDERGLAEFAQAAEGGEMLIILSGVFGGLAIQVAMFVVASTLGLSVQQRRREVALLRAIGTTPKQLSRMITGEAMTVGVLATVLGCLPGAVLGEWLFDRLAGFGVFEPVLKFHQGWVPAAAAIIVGLLSAWGAAWVAARYAAQTRPVEAMQEVSEPKRWLTPFRLWCGLSSLIGGAVLAYLTITVMDGPLAASTAGPAVTLVATAVALFAPGITRVLVALLRVPVRAVTGLGGYLATLNARARWLPMSGAVTPIMLATGLAIFMLYFQTTQVEAAKRAYTANLLADAVVTSSTEDVTRGLVDEVRRLPGVGSASAYVTSKGYNEKPSDSSQDEDGVELHGVTAEAAAQTRQAEVVAGQLADLRGDTIALPADRAERLRVGVGDEISMRLGDGAVVGLRVVATLRSNPDFSSALLPASTLAPHTTAGMADQILVTAAPGTSPARLGAALSGLVQDRPGLKVADRDTLTAAYVDKEQANAWVNYLVVGMILIYAAISVVNTLVMATAHRRREFGLQRLTGTTRGQVLRMITVEALLVAVIGGVLGTIVAGSMLLPFSAAVSDSVLPAGPLWIYPAVLALGAVLTLVATLVPTWLALRTKTSAIALAPE
ncbi:FtsX-like permease family protein [Amycolatopsis anabasis]|uniref:FtsX-like permease family protein n=1 Tax=Amycolatopsis anabasis TaxID=1840409 RepID=UPI00131D06BC|nr:FtsX-like permease family protein [Amycolatopsis anabasis]